MPGQHSGGNVLGDRVISLQIRTEWAELIAQARDHIDSAWGFENVNLSKVFACDSN